jgi:hypothetical protein
MREAAIYAFGAMMTILIYAIGTTLYDNANAINSKFGKFWSVAGTGAAILILTLCVMVAL